jgi:peroxiredoxin
MTLSLAQCLAAYADELRSSGSPYAIEYDRLVGRLRVGKVGSGAPEQGEAMPPFLLPDAQGRMVALAQLLRWGPVVVSFNRGHWCPFCEIELTAFGEAHEAFAALNATIVSIMPDRQFYTREFAATLKRPPIILTDMDNGYALSLGLAMSVGESVRRLLVADGLRLDEYQGNEAWLLPIPATFVVSREGSVLARFVDPDFRERMEVSAVLEALQKGE